MRRFPAQNVLNEGFLAHLPTYRPFLLIFQHLFNVLVEFARPILLAIKALGDERLLQIVPTGVLPRLDEFIPAYNRVIEDGLWFVLRSHREYRDVGRFKYAL